MTRSDSDAPHTGKTNTGFSVQPVIAKCLLVKLAPGAELEPQLYTEGYVIIPMQDSSLVRVTRDGDQIVKEEAVEHKARQPFWVDPPAHGQTFTLRNAGPAFGIFQKFFPDPGEPITRPQPELPKERLVIIGRSGQRIDFDVEVATTLEEQRVGLALRPSIAADGGMLFDWGTVRRVKMWAKDMLVPVDIVFVDETGLVTLVAADQQPGSTTVSDSGIPVRAVLEVAGGTMARIHAGTGSKVEHRIFP